MKLDFKEVEIVYEDMIAMGASWLIDLDAKATASIAIHQNPHCLWSVFVSIYFDDNGCAYDSAITVGHITTERSIILLEKPGLDLTALVWEMVRPKLIEMKGYSAR